jgi:hypothetical protein
MSFGYYFNLYAISLATNWNELEFGRLQDIFKAFFWLNIKGKWSLIR